MDELGKVLIIIHATFGGIALISGAISLISKKGKQLHKKSGKIFYYSLIVSVTLSLVIAVMPNHKSAFLFCIGLFSNYFILGGYRSLKFKQKNISIKLDKMIAYLIIVVGITMIMYPVLLQNQSNVVLLVFGIVAIIFGVIDIFLLQNINRLRKNWLKIHLSKMISGYVAAVTAFIVVNQWLPGVWAWFTPAIFGNIYLAYWFYKLRKKILLTQYIKNSGLNARTIMNFINLRSVIIRKISA